MNRTRPCWTKIAEQLIHVAAAVIQALKRLGLPPPRSAATGMPRRPLVACSPRRRRCWLRPPPARWREEWLGRLRALPARRSRACFAADRLAHP
jgi:hypothetical protein